MKKLARYFLLFSCLTYIPNTSFATEALQLVLNNVPIVLTDEVAPLITAEGYALLPLQTIGHMLDVTVIENLPLVVAQGENISQGLDVLINIDISTGNVLNQNDEVIWASAAVVNNGTVYIPAELFSTVFGYAVSNIDGIININSIKGGANVAVSSLENAAIAEVIALVNQHRAAAGVYPLTLNPTLSAIAQLRTDDMNTANYYSYDSPTYGTPFETLKTYGITYSAAGVNIAKGYPTATTVMDAWMHSEGHRENILSSTYTQIGIGYNNVGNYWTQFFLTP